MQANTQKMANKPKLREKIDAKCKECLWDASAEGTWRQQVENCSSYTCPIYPVRPTSTGGALNG